MREAHVADHNSPLPICYGYDAHLHRLVRTFRQAKPWMGPFKFRIRALSNLTISYSVRAAQEMLDTESPIADSKRR